MLLSLLLFAGAAFFWIKGNEYQLRHGHLQHQDISPSPANQSGTNSTIGTKSANNTCLLAVRKAEVRSNCFGLATRASRRPERCATQEPLLRLGGQCRA